MDALTLVSTLAMLGAAVIGGAFFAFSSFVMRALARLSPANGVLAMQSINVTVINAHFLGAFVGTAALSAGALVLACASWGRSGAAWIAAGAALYLVGTFVVTLRCNVPLNDGLARLAADDVKAAAAWQWYVSRWTWWNHVRTAAAVLATLCFCVGLLRR